MVTGISDNKSVQKFVGLIELDEFKPFLVLKLRLITEK